MTAAKEKLLRSMSTLSGDSTDDQDVDIVESLVAKFVERKQSVKVNTLWCYKPLGGVLNNLQNSLKLSTPF